MYEFDAGFDPYDDYDDFVDRDPWDDDDRSYDKFVDDCLHFGFDPRSPLASYQLDALSEIPVGLMLDDEYDYVEDEELIEF